MRLGVATVVCCLSIMGMCVADDARASMRQATNIPSEGLVPALKQLAHERGFQVVFQSEIVGAAQTHGAVGEFTPEEALKQLLKGTGLSYRYLDEKTVTIVPLSLSASGSGEGSGQPSLVPTSSAQSQVGLWSDFLLAQATAQTPAASIQIGSNDEPKRPSQIEEIVVTAQRRSQVTSEVPMSITAYSQRQLDDLRVENIRDLATVAPGLYIPPQSSFLDDVNSIAIRGITSLDNSPTTQIYIDETPIALRQSLVAINSGSPEPLIFDIDRVEVLKGPQGTLFGASAMGGAVRFIMPQPSLSTTSGVVKTDLGVNTAGTFNQELGAEIGAPIIQDRLGFRASAWAQSLGGFIDQVDPISGDVIRSNANTKMNYAGRLAFAYAPSENLTITPAFYDQHHHEDNGNGVWFSGLAKPSEEGNSFGDAAQPFTDDLRLASLAVKYQMGDVSLQSDTSYMWRKSSALDSFTALYTSLFFGQTQLSPELQGLQGNLIRAADYSYAHEWQQELRISSSKPNSQLDWVAGLYFGSTSNHGTFAAPNLNAYTEFYANSSQSQYFLGNPNPDPALDSLPFYTASATMSEVATAGFVDVTYKVTPNLKLDSGVRVERHVVKDQDTVIGGVLTGGTSVQTLAPDQAATPVTPRVSLTWQYDPNQMVYFAAAKGFRAGGGDSTTFIPTCAKSVADYGYASPPSSFQSDSLWSYEFGEKGRFFNERLTFEGDVFYTKWSNIQQSLPLPSCSNSFTANVGSAISKGVEASIGVNVAAGLKANLLFAYVDAYHDQTIYSAPDANGNRVIVVGNGDPIVGSTNSGVGAGSPPWTITFRGDYSTNIDSLWSGSRAYFRSDFRWQSSPPQPDLMVAGAPLPGTFKIVNSYGVLNCALGVKHEGLDLSLYVTNLANVRPINNYTSSSPVIPAFFNGTLIQPRTIGLTTFYRF